MPEPRVSGFIWIYGEDPRECTYSLGDGLTVTMPGGKTYTAVVKEITRSESDSSVAPIKVEFGRERQSS